MRIPLIKKGQKQYIELPDEFSESQSVELFHLRDNFYLLTNLEQEKKKEKEAELTDEELSLLAKLNSLKFSERTPTNVHRMLGEREKNVLKELTKRGCINIFYGKYKNVGGVYNIKNDVYERLRTFIHKEKHKDVARESPLTSLFIKGFAILSEGEAKMFSEKIKKEGMVGRVIGVKSFDEKFYVVTRRYFYNACEKIKGMISSDGIGAKELAERIKEDEEGCIAVLKLLAEKGDIVEKRKNYFALIE